jgi:hypothetical protein
MTVLCTSAFHINQQERRAILLDLSEGGARFGSAAAAGTFTFSPGQSLDFELLTPYGMATLSGRVVWASADSVLYTWGVQFTGDVPVDRNPMRELLAA